MESDVSEPLQWGHGFSAVEITSTARVSRTQSGGFNGATAFQPWKLNDYSSEFVSPNQLQWGHGFSAVEMVSAARHTSRAKTASMGPRLFSRGNVADAAGGLPTTTLQWGHGFSAVEMTGLGVGGRVCGGFNGATAFQPWKLLMPATMFDQIPGFNGATAFQPWKWRLGKDKEEDTW